MRESREVDSAEEQHVKKAITRVYNLPKFPFTALELSKNIDEEQVAEVFVRINSRVRGVRFEFTQDLSYRITIVAFYGIA